MTGKTKKHICIIQNVELGTTEALSVFLTNITKNFSADTTIVDLIVSDASRSPKDLIEQVHTIYTTRTKLYSILDNFIFSLKTFTFLRKIQKALYVDVLHCIRPNSSLLGAVFFKFFINPQVKIIYNVRGPWIDVAILRKHVNPLFSRLFKHVAYFSEFVLSKFVWRFVFVSIPLRDFYSRKLKLKSEKTFVIPPGVDLSHFFYKKDSDMKRMLFNNQHDIVIGHVGGLAFERDLSFLIQAFQQLHQTDSNYKLVFVGDGPAKKQLETLSSKLELSQSILFTGSVNRENVPKYLSALDIGICHLPDTLAYRCSFPLKVLEYLACGLPVLASNIIAHAEIAKSLDNVHLYDLSLESLAKKIVFLSQDKNNLQHQVQDKIRQYDWSVLAKRYDQIYD